MIEMYEDNNGNVAEIVYDEYPDNPRIEYEPISTMICFHKRYELGDNDHGYCHEDYNGWGELQAAIEERESVSVIKPVYLYDHSGIVLSTTPFSCPWDSGQVGFIFVTGDGTEEQLDLEFETYNDYVQGNAYGIEFANGDEIDSLYGYTSLEDARADIKEEYPEMRRNL